MKKAVVTVALGVLFALPALAQGKLVVGYEADATSMDPGHVTDINTMHVLTQMYEGLVKIGAAGAPVPSLATRWSVSQDGLNYTFTLRDGVKFSNGDPLDAEAVAFSFERQLNSKNPGNQFGPWPFAGFFFGSVDSVKAVSKNQVQFKMKSPNSGFIYALSVATGFVVSPKAAMAEGKNFALKGSGSGPYMMDSWSRGGQLVLKPNPNYWGPKPKTASMVWVPIVQESQRAVALQSGTVDMVINPPPESLSKLKSAGFKVADAAGPHIWWIGLNTSKPPFDNKLVRQALNYAIDRKAIVDGILFGTGIPASQPLAPVQMGHNPNVNKYNYDPKKAKELLAQAGYPNGFTANFLVPTSGSGMQSPVPMGTALQAYWSQIGVKVNISQLDWGTFLSKIGAGAKESDLEMWELSWMDSAIDPSIVFDPLLSSKSWPPGFNTGFYKNVEVDKLLEQGLAERNQTKRKEIYQRVSALVNEDAPWVFVDHAKEIVGYSSKVQGFKLDPVFPFLLKLWNVEVK